VKVVQYRSTHPSRSIISSSNSVSQTAKRRAPDEPAEGSRPVATRCIRFGIRNFASLVHPRGSYAETGAVRLCGKLWHLRVYPRGHSRSRTDAVVVSWCLVVRNDPDNEQYVDHQRGNSGSGSGDAFRYVFRVRDWAMDPSPRYDLHQHSARYGYGVIGHRRSLMLSRGLDSQGTLVIDLGLRFFPVEHRGDALLAASKRPKPNPEDLGSRLWSSRSESFDVSFLVDETVFRAHKCVLAARARTLLELTEDEDNQHRHTPIPIVGSDPDVFGFLLEYAYKADDAEARNLIGKASDPHAFAWSLLVAADKWGCTGLKRSVESVLAEEEFLLPRLCCDVLLKADAMSCTLLKERAMDKIASDPLAATRKLSAPTSTLQKEPTGWDRLRESPRLLFELLAHAAAQRRNHRESTRSPEHSSAADFLRDKLSENGFEVDA